LIKRGGNEDRVKVVYNGIHFLDYKTFANETDPYLKFAV
jgi:hypothetical protein